MNDRQQKTLVYRVEMDESSVAQSIRTARETVGIGLSQAVDEAARIGQAVNFTAATAMARAGSHLDFMDRTRQILAAPAETQLAPHGIGTIKALGVALGSVTPRFSETQTSLDQRAGDKLFGDPTGVIAMQRASAVANAGMFATGVGLMFVPGGQVAGAALMATQALASIGVSTGMDRAIERRMLAAHMRGLGMDSAMNVARSYEDVANGLNVGHQEAMQIGMAALASVDRSRLRTASGARGVLVGALNDWKSVGKGLEMEKEEAMSTAAEFYRLGVTPGSLGSIVGGISAMSRGFNINPAALATATMDVMRQASVGGYDVMSAGNQFLLQSGMISQMMRSSVISRSDLAAAAGFSGPQAEQVSAVSQRMTSAMMQMRETGIGQLVSAGVLMGGGGDIRSLAAAAGRMTAQDMAEFAVRRNTNVNLPEEQEAILGTIRSAMKQAGINPTPNAVHQQLVGMGMDFGVAKVLAHQDQRSMSIARLAARSRAESAFFEGNQREKAIPAFFGSVASGLGDMAEMLWEGGEEEGSALMTGAVFGIGAASLQGKMASVRGRKYLGIKGIGRAITDVGDAMLEPLRDIWSDWQWGKDSQTGEYKFLSDVSRVRGIGGFISKSEWKSMSRDEERALFADVDKEMMDYREAFGREANADMRAIERVNKRRERILSGVLDNYSSGDALRLRGDIDAAQDRFGVSISESSMMNFVAKAGVVRQKIAGAANQKEKDRIAGEFQGWLSAVGGDELKDANIEDVSAFLLNGTKTKLSAEALKEYAQVDRLHAAMTERANALGLTDRTRREEVTKRVFKEGSDVGERFLSSDGMDDASFRRLVEEAGAKGQLNEEYARGAISGRSAGMSVGEAVRRRLIVDHSLDMVSASEMASKEGSKDEAAPSSSAGGDDLKSDIRELVSTLKDIVKRDMIKGGSSSWLPWR